VTEPLWVSAEEAIAINRMLVAQFGGLDAGVRDENLLQAALARPLNKWHYDEPKPNLFTLAAAYAFGIAKGHVFHDGNKRAAYVVAVTFLDINDIVCAPSQSDIIETMVAVADGSTSEAELADWFRRNIRRPIGLAESPATTPLSGTPARPKRGSSKPRSASTSS
jgi:death-on-curing protein